MGKREKERWEKWERRKERGGAIGERGGEDIENKNLLKIDIFFM